MMPSTPHTRFRFDAGRLALDLIATGPHPASPHPAERLTTPADLHAWLAGATPPLPAQPDPSWLPPFRELRDAIAELVDAQLDSGPEQSGSALEVVNARAAAPTPAIRAVRSEDGSGQFVRALSGDPYGPTARAALLALVARDAVELLTDPAARAALRRCAGEACGLVYLDTSRGRRRRWCSSEVCGNRERVARHRRRAAVGVAVQP
jgi:predicted RNA-binding Zn ribbon-like protein